MALNEIEANGIEQGFVHFLKTSLVVVTNYSIIIMQKKLIKVNPSDNVAVALVNLTQGEEIQFEGELIKVLY